MRRISLLFIISLLLPVGSAAAQTSWSTLPPMIKPRAEATAVMHQGSMYVFNGFAPNIKIENSVEKYDPVSGQWTLLDTTSSALGNAVTHNGIVLHGQDVWLIGGRIGNHPGKVSKLVWIYNIGTGQWRQGPALPVPAAGGGAALVNNKIYLFGGLDPKAQCDVDHHFVLDLARQNAGWQDISDVAAMPIPRNHFATAVLDDKIYAIGGQFGHDGCTRIAARDLAYVHRFDPASLSWTRLADLPAVQSHAEPSTFAHNGFIYSAGGQISGDKVLRYDPHNNSWAHIHTLPQPLLAPAAQMINGRLLVAGGGAPNTLLPVREVVATTIDEMPAQQDNNPGEADSDAVFIAAIEAEDYDLRVGTASHQWVETTLPGSSQAQAMITTPDNGTLKRTSGASPMLSYQLNFEQAGLHYLWIRGWGDSDSTGEGKSDSLHAGIDGVMASSADKIDGFPPGWHWSQSTRDRAVATLLVPDAGLHTVDLWMREDGLAIDKLIVTNDPMYIPEGSGAASGQTDAQTQTQTQTPADDTATTDEQPAGGSEPEPQADSPLISIEAEDYDSISAGSSHSWVGSDLPGASGGGAMITTPDRGTLLHGSNNSPMMSYQVYFEQAGKYSLWVRGWGDTNAQGEGKSDSIHAGLNGVLAGSADKIDQFPAGWNWSRSTRDKAVASLMIPHAGMHEVNLWMREDGFAVDRIILSADPAYTPSDEDVAGSDDIPLSAGSNSAPLANAGPDTSIDFGSVLTLQGSVSDDGNPHNSISVSWQKKSGPGEVTFGDNSLLQTTAGFSAPGLYILRLIANDGQLTDEDLIGIRVLDVTAPVARIDAYTAWDMLQTSDGSRVTARHEAGAVAANGKIYMLGGRGNRPVESYDPTTGRWQSHGRAPVDLHHFQPVLLNNRIYAIGALRNAGYPREQVAEHIYVFNLQDHSWSQGGSIPEHRRRGSTGAAVYNNKIYIVGGNRHGHDGPAVNWLDEYDPATGRWTVLANAPHARDHLSVAVAEGKLIVAAGRRSAYPNVFGDTEAATDVYDFASGKWSQADDIPTSRAGTMTVAVGAEVVVIGGESMASTAAHNQVESLDVISGQWRALQPLGLARHSGGAAVLGNQIHVISGNTTRGADNETSYHETLQLPSRSQP